VEKCVLSQESRGSCGSHIALFAACRWHLRGSSNDSSGRQAGGLSVRVWLVAQCSSAVSVACTESGRPPNACATAAIPRRYRIPPSPPPPGVAVHQAPLSYMYVPRRSSVLAPVRTAFDIARVGPGVVGGLPAAVYRTCLANHSARRRVSFAPPTWVVQTSPLPAPPALPLCYPRHRSVSAALLRSRSHLFYPTTGAR